LDQELNFDDLGSKSTKKKPAKSKPEKKKDEVTGFVKEEGQVVTAGIVLGIPTDNKWYPDNFELKDIMQVNGAEFIKWARMVYPRDLSKYQEVFEGSKKRLRMFHKIVAFHKFSLFNMGKQNIDNKVPN